MPQAATKEVLHSVEICFVTSLLYTVMLIYRHDMSSGLQEYVSIWTLFDSFWIFLPQSGDGFGCR